MGVAACVPRQDCQVSFPQQLISVQAGDPWDPGAPSQDAEVLVLREEARDGREGREGRPVPLANLAQFMDKKEQCTAWFQPCCSQYMSTEATSQLDAAEQPMTTKEMTAQEGEIYELSEDISEELKLMGMEVWLQAALSREEDKCTKTASEARSYSASRQPEEEPGANEEAECKATSSSPCMPLDDVGEIADVLEAARPLEPSDALAPSTASAADEHEAVPKAVEAEVEETAAPADPAADDAAAEGDYPRLFHISALDLGDDAADEPSGAVTDRTVLEGLHHVATASSAASGSAGATSGAVTAQRKAPKVKRRTRAEVMLW